MAINKETERAALILLGVALLSKLGEAFSAASKALTQLQDDASNAIQQQGANLYEVLHPDEKDHANDLPGKRMPPEAVLAIAQLVGFPDPKLAAAIAMAESNGYPNAKNINAREYSVGLWQINTKVHPYTPEQMRDPLQNAQAALKLYLKKGWQPWGAYTSGKYKERQKGVLA